MTDQISDESLEDTLISIPSGDEEPVPAPLPAPTAVMPPEAPSIEPDSSFTDPS